MKLLLLALITVCITTTSFASFTTQSSAVASEEVVAPSTLDMAAISNLTVSQIQTYLGRKLTLQEKVRWYFAKKAIVKIKPDGDEELARKGRTKAYLGFGFALAGLLLFGLLAIPGIIFSNNALRIDKENPGILGDAKGFAKAGQIMGWVSVGLMVLALIIILAYLSLISSH